ncbi:hypothetical protein [Luteolibacter luteus]|uniref:Uncharacterized protein n=1 Tax=Luteolibacter luteus TaxID=2728835 RepID=A0A858RM06_9BACT|nr:hypothetical protein [Luteolibacter luteus]QJE97997.1 hypothetical protein HHL09_20125 [Luteolibacter luteus]
MASAAAVLGIPVEALSYAKALGSPGFRLNGNVHEKEFLPWLLLECWAFWSACIGWEELEMERFPERAKQWRKAPPQDEDAAGLSEEAFQWLRLIHGDKAMKSAKQSAEDWLAAQAADVTAGLLQSTERLGDPESLLSTLYFPASFPPVIPAWYLDASPFEVLQADKVQFWQWTKAGVKETCRLGIPVPPKSLIFDDEKVSGNLLPPRHGSYRNASPWQNETPTANRRSLLDFLPSKQLAPSGRESHPQSRQPRHSSSPNSRSHAPGKVETAD